MLIVRGIMTKVVLRMNKMPHIALNHVVTLWVVWLKNCIIVSLQRYPKVQMIYLAYRAVTLWVVRISTECAKKASHCSGRETSTKYTDLQIHSVVIYKILCFHVFLELNNKNLTHWSLRSFCPWTPGSYRFQGFWSPYKLSGVLKYCIKLPECQNVAWVFFIFRTSKVWHVLLFSSHFCKAKGVKCFVNSRHLLAYWACLLFVQAGIQHLDREPDYATPGHISF